MPTPLAIALWALIWPVSFGVLVLMLRSYRRTPMSGLLRWMARVTGVVGAILPLGATADVPPRSVSDGVALLVLGPPFAALGVSIALLIVTREAWGANRDMAKLERLRERDPELMERFEQNRVIRFMRRITRSKAPP